MANFDSNCVFRVLDQNRPFLLGLKMAEFEAKVKCVLWVILIYFDMSYGGVLRY
jgi:hypothetical protein